MKKAADIKKRRNAARNIISCILSFVLSVCVLLMTTAAIVQFGVLGENMMYTSINTSGYHAVVYHELMENIKSITIPTGFPESIYEGVITESDIYNDINGSLMARSRNIRYTTKSLVIKQKLEENIDKYFSEIEYTASSEETEAIDNYIEIIAELYDKCLDVPLSDYIMKSEGTLQKLLIAVLAAMIFSMSVIIYIIFKLYRNVYGLLRYLSYASTGSAIMLMLLPAWVILNKWHYRLNLSPESFYILFTKYIDSILKMFLAFGVMWLILGAAFALPGIFKKR